METLPAAKTPQRVPATPEMRYVGPAYKTGILMPDSPTLYRPAEMTRAQVQAFLARYPHKASWWENAPPAEDKPI